MAIYNTYTVGVTVTAGYVYMLGIRGQRVQYVSCLESISNYVVVAGNAG